MQFLFRYFNDIKPYRNLVFGQIEDFEVNPNREPVKTAFFFGEPEPNL